MFPLKRLTRYLLHALSCMGIIVFALPATAGKAENTFGVGASFYTGTLATSLAPRFAPQFQYESADLSGSKMFNFAHRFQLALLVSGKKLAGGSESYNGIQASYELGLRLNFGQKSLIPFLDIAPALGFFGLLTSGGPATNSTNQAAFKYGYAVTTGFDRYGDGGGRGTSGWGLSAGYFYFLPSPSVFEFSAGKTSARGVRIDFRFHFGGQ